MIIKKSGESVKYFLFELQKKKKKKRERETKKLTGELERCEQQATLQVGCEYSLPSSLGHLLSRAFHFVIRSSSRETNAGVFDEPKRTRVNSGLEG